MEKLPTENGLTVESKKLTDYLLKTDHPIGGGKAKWFLKQGFSLEDLETCKTALQEHARIRPVIKVEESQFGKKFQIECSLNAPCGETKCILAVWIVEEDEIPRLVTAYPKKN